MFLPFEGERLLSTALLEGFLLAREQAVTEPDVPRWTGAQGAPTGVPAACRFGGLRGRSGFPHHAAALLSLGVPVTLAAYVGRERLDVPRPRLMRLGAAALAFALVLFLGLDLLADEIAPHGH